MTGRDESEVGGYYDGHDQELSDFREAGDPKPHGGVWDEDDEEENEG